MPKRHNGAWPNGKARPLIATDLRGKNVSTRSRWAAATLAGLLFGSAPGIAAAQASIDRLPRPVARTAAADKIAAALAQQDAQFRRQAAECQALGKPGGYWFSVGARRLLESASLYSVEAKSDWFCGGAHPDSEVIALTFDMQSGAPYDLTRAFHVANNGHLADAALPMLADYIKKAETCGDTAAKDDLQTADLTLGVTSKYLIFYFSVPHVIAACYPPAQVPFATLASLADKTELQRLGPPFGPHQAANCDGVIAVGGNADEIAPATIARGAPRVHFIASTTDKLKQCPSQLPACQLSSFLVPGNVVLAGASADGFRCVTYRTADGRETSGFLPAAAVVEKPAANPALADWLGRWVRDREASITIARKGAMLAVTGEATWGSFDPERVRLGNVRSGDIDAVSAPRGNMVAIGPGYDGAGPPDLAQNDDCRARLRLFGPYLAVEDNTGCGGANVSFTGVYSRQH